MRRSAPDFFGLQERLENELESEMMAKEAALTELDVLKAKLATAEKNNKSFASGGFCLWKSPLGHLPDNIKWLEDVWILKNTEISSHGHGTS